MSDAKKELLAQAGTKKAAIAAASAKQTVLNGLSHLLRSPTPNPAGLPAGVKITTNSQSVARFPLPLTITSAGMLAVGAIAYMRGHHIVGGMLAAAGLGGLGAAAAAPELNAAINKATGVNLPGIT